MSLENDLLGPMDARGLRGGLASVDAHTEVLKQEANKNSHKHTHTTRKESTPRSTQVRALVGR